jgi:plasmid stabilization system protein ParE
MRAYRLTRKAKADLREIWSYIAARNEEAADRVENAVYEACEAPLRGHTRKDLTALPVRFWTLIRYRKYVIVYEPESRPLTIIRILHGARNVPRELG